MKVIIIDNYDSFTWNLYEYLCQEGANVQVYRNDKITIDELSALNPDKLVISPGPGHPDTDSGISKDVVRHFSGKVPILGVCMGQQCMFSVFGGEVSFAGEILHGKTSTIEHDGKGIFSGLTKTVEVTRYHSLAGTQPTIPDCLDVSAKTANGIIMGVRHKEYTVEGVQFHPESILTEQGHQMIRNFLTISGGKWVDSVQPANTTTTTGMMSILDKIYAQRRLDVEELKQLPGKSFEDLEKDYKLGLAPKQLDFVERTKRSKMNLFAEIKRASPSKGDINLSAHAASQAKIYAECGAAAISVLTEPHWFKGSIDDLRQARLAVGQALGEDQRPAILRKEFVFDEYQILEARLAGADTVLLIVKMLDNVLLKKLYDYSLSLNMEPLVEVASAEEMTRAIQLGAKVIGVNNRDLHSFKVDMNTTSQLTKQTPQGSILAALSGITGKPDVEKYAKEGVSAVLVGESLMRAENTKQFIQDLISI